MTHIKNSGRYARCPIAGCPAKVTRKSLEEAPDIANLVAEARRSDRQKQH